MSGSLLRDAWLRFVSWVCNLRRLWDIWWVFCRLEIPPEVLAQPSARSSTFPGLGVRSVTPLETAAVEGSGCMFVQKLFL